MTISVPNIVRLTPNHYDGREQTLGVFVHYTAGPGDRPLEQEYQNTIRYFLEHPIASAHFVIGPAQVCRMVRDEDSAWHAEENNLTHLSFELAQPASYPGFTDFQYRAAAEITGDWAAKYGLPVKRVFSQRERGIIGHEDSEQGKRNGRQDPGPKWDWARFLKLVGQDDDDFEFDIGPGFAAFLKAHPELGRPRHEQRPIPGFGTYVALTPTPRFPHGAMLVWRQWTNSIAVAQWEAPYVG